MKKDENRSFLVILFWSVLDKEGGKQNEGTDRKKKLKSKLKQDSTQVVTMSYPKSIVLSRDTRSIQVVDVCDFCHYSSNAANIEWAPKDVVTSFRL